MKRNLRQPCLLFFANCASAQQLITNDIYEYAATENGLTFLHISLMDKCGKQSGAANNMRQITRIVFLGQTYYYNLFINRFFKIKGAIGQWSTVAGNFY